MQRSVFGFDPSHHVARHHFDPETPHSWTPQHLAIHREWAGSFQRNEGRGGKGPATWRAIGPSLFHA